MAKKTGTTGKRKKKTASTLPKGLRDYTNKLIKASLAEDIGPGDITSKAVIPTGKKYSFKITAKEDMVIAGINITEAVFNQVDKSIKFKALVADGKEVKKGRVIARLSGNAVKILAGERVALNFLQRLSGIATATRALVKKVAASNVTILDTRKTTPCMRLLEKYAVLAGGGGNHRFGLFDGVLIKDNHIAVAGGITKALKEAKKKLPPETTIEVEVKTLKEVKEALTGEANIIMLDNMAMDKIKKAVKLIDNRALVEVSGGVTEANAAKLASLGVDFLSSGALTHSAKAMDLSLDAE